MAPHDLIKKLVENSNTKTATVAQNINSNIDNFMFVNSYEFHYLTINRNIIKKIGYPIFDLFLNFDDLEYTKRISKSFKIKKIHDTYYSHPSGIIRSFSRLLSPVSLYYISRNSIRVKINRKSILISLIIVPFLYDFNSVIKCYKYILKGIVDGFLKVGGSVNIPQIKKKMEFFKIKDISKKFILISSQKKTHEMASNYQVEIINPTNITNFKLIKFLFSNSVLVIDDFESNKFSIRLLPLLIWHDSYIYREGAFYKLKKLTYN